MIGGRSRWRNVILSLILLALVAPGCGSDRSSSGTDRDPTALDDDERIYLSRRPAVGPLHVVDLANEDAEGRILARTLQGIINRKLARLYLVDSTDGENAEHRSWLRLYEQQYGVKRTWEGGLDDALAKFAGEVGGYVTASFSEPWTVNAATTLASIDGAVVGFESQRARLQAAGLREIQSLVGRWADGLSCYRDLMAEYPRMGHRGLAILPPGAERLRDFLVQQGVLTVGGYPNDPEWPAVRKLLANTPHNIPVYGYIARDGVEEFVGVVALSRAGKFLIPTDTTPNLSFHVAVRAQREIGRRARPSPAATCRVDEVNVSIAISDGDNLALPVIRYFRDDYWRSERRGRLPLGWSITPGLPILAPAIADYYFGTATDNDEWVALLGMAYAYPAFYPDPEFFFATTFAQMSAIGLDVFWTIDPMAYVDPTDPRAGDAWRAFATTAHGTVPSGVLGGYGPHPLYPTGTLALIALERWPVLRAPNNYADTPEVLAERIEALLNEEPRARPLVTFFSAAVWNNSLDGLVEALAPLQARGVRFLLPSEALACVKGEGRSATRFR